MKTQCLMILARNYSIAIKMYENPLEITWIVGEEGLTPPSDILRGALVTVELLKDGPHRIIATGNGALYLGLNRNRGINYDHYVPGQRRPYRAAPRNGIDYLHVPHRTVIIMNNWSFRCPFYTEFHAKLFNEPLTLIIECARISPVIHTQILSGK